MLTPDVWKELITLEWFYLKISPSRLDSVFRKEGGGIAEITFLAAIFSKKKMSFYLTLSKYLSGKTKW
ncbi:MULTISPECIES: hypothetical protein [unclassified Synechocystis]|uniref:hypothetical protein n=1 Tax=unclassified Synechocystis TaxID=2640012 RepID=UPI0002EB1229|nr:MULTISPECIES: hypothetical protein [unclassified Synechocystis]ALJ66754.1 hypothetical protein AOY38_02170 [Synechocystis sp. PCC 6803]AVP88597.1 hypothetical protein C7I86_02185 [Synechocystis sp. IPPAS B-1465]MBD2618264.1 hypothetical protein [Synechocystis sp. FACHB-898]MBD2637731.1 hypothetical protein [Synechocystis sp. FACHB-908]MBD2661324.1 hypothetical protein [Synechocystis sp. FACHB-929]